MSPTASPSDSSTASPSTYFANITQSGTKVIDDILECIKNDAVSQLSRKTLRRVLVGPQGSGKTKIIEQLRQGIEKEYPIPKPEEAAGQKSPLIFSISMRRIYGPTSEQRLLFFLRNLRLELFLQLRRGLDINPGLFAKLAMALGFKKEKKEEQEIAAQVNKALDELENEVASVEKMLGGERIDEASQATSRVSTRTEQRKSGVGGGGKVKLASDSEKGKEPSPPRLEGTGNIDASKLRELLEKIVEEISQSAKLQRKSVISPMNVEPPLFRLLALLTRAQIPTVMLIDNAGRLPFEERATLIGMLNRLPVSCLVVTLRREQFEEEIAEQFEFQERIILPAMTGDQLLEYPSLSKPNATERPKRLVAEYFVSQLKTLGIQQRLPIFPLSIYLPFVNWISQNTDGYPCLISEGDPEKAIAAIDAQFATLYEQYLLHTGVEPHAVRVAQDLSKGMTEDDVRNCLLLGYRDSTEPPENPTKPSIKLQLESLCHGPSPLAYRMHDRYWLSPLLGYLALSLKASVPTASRPARVRRVSKKPAQAKPKRKSTSHTSSR